MACDLTDIKVEMARLASSQEHQAETLDVLTTSVVDHVKRTDLLEQKVAKFEGVYAVIVVGIPVLFSLANILINLVKG